MGHGQVEVLDGHHGDGGQRYFVGDDPSTCMVLDDSVGEAELENSQGRDEGGVHDGRDPVVVVIQLGHYVEGALRGLCAGVDLDQNPEVLDVFESGRGANENFVASIARVYL